MSASGLSNWWPKDGLWWDREHVVELGEEFGSDGPAVLDWLSCQAKLQNDGGWVKAGYRACARGCFVAADRVRPVVSAAVRLGALDDFDGDDRRFTCRISGWKADNDRVQDALRKRAARSAAKVETDAVEPNAPDGDVRSGPAASGRVRRSPQKSLKGEERRVKRTSPDPSASGGERPVAPVKPSGRRKRDLDRYAAELSAHLAALEAWAPHPADLNGLAEPAARLTAAVEGAVTESVWGQWLSSVHVHRLDGGTLVLAAAPAAHPWIEQRYLALLTQAAKAVLPSIDAIDLVACSHTTTGEETR